MSETILSSDEQKADDMFHQQQLLNTKNTQKRSVAIVTDSASDFIRTVQETSFIPGEGEGFRKQLAMAASLDRVTCVESFRFHSDEVLMEDFIKAGFLEICDAEAR